MNRIQQIIEISQPIVLVLADGDSQGAISHKKGHLFETFIAKLLAFDGFPKPTKQNINITSDGIELDISTQHRLTQQKLVAECKAYSTNRPAKELTNFYGKLTTERFSDPNTMGLFVALPGLVANAEEQLSKILENDKHFKCLRADNVVELLRQHELITDPAESDELLSDFAIVISEHGIYSAAKILDQNSRAPIHIRCWGLGEAVPTPAIELIQGSRYADGISVQGAVQSNEIWLGDEEKEQTIVSVSGGSNDFEYQLPAGPKFFVGRKNKLNEIEEFFATNLTGDVLVFNGQSGWGKSSLALRFSNEINKKKNGLAIVFDSRTASTPEYVRRCLHEIIVAAEDTGILHLNANSSFASVQSTIKTLQRATWATDKGPVMAFFDQFENVFRNVDLTKAFRDLALSIKEVELPFYVGFSWKTDFVTLAESHPYQLRDDIRNSGKLIMLDPMGPGDVNTLLRRLEKAITEKLGADLKSRLREYSAGLPWLFKKLASHVIEELKDGKTQETLLDQSLNVRSLFESDLAELSPNEVAALKRIAGVCPVSISEVIDVVSPDIVQSLIDRRLLVSVGEFLDTYWDIFRDFLNTGEVPIKESYILRQTPGSVGNLLKTVKNSGGSLSVAAAADQLEMKEGVIFNLSRSLRQMGILVSDSPGNISIAEDISSAADFNEMVHERVSNALKRNQAFASLQNLFSEEKEEATFEEFASLLPVAFAGVQGSKRTWETYARVFLKWFEYGRLITVHGKTIQLGAPQKKVLELVDAKSLFSFRSRRPTKFPESAPRPAIELAAFLVGIGPNPNLSKKANLKALNDLRALGIARYDRRSGALLIEVTQIFNDDGDVVKDELLELIKKMPGAMEACEALSHEPRTSATEIGKVLAEGYGKEWAESTMKVAGSYFRAWASTAGVNVEQLRKGRRTKNVTKPQLFD